jgi:hypothetical protein
MNADTPVTRTPSLRLTAARACAWALLVAGCQNTGQNEMIGTGAGAAGGAGSIAASLILINSAYATHLWIAYQDDYIELKKAFALIQPKSLIVVGRSRDDVTDLPIFHAPTLAVHYANSFVPNLYTLQGMQPVEVRSERFKVPIEVSGQEQPASEPLRYGAMVALTKQGCNGGACHGSGAVVAPAVRLSRPARVRRSDCDSNCNR